MSTFSIFLILIIIVCLLLMLVIMVQNPKGGGLSSSFGGGGTQIVGGVKKTGDFLDRSTWALKGNFTQSDSKLLQDGTTPTSAPATIPEAPAPAANESGPLDTIE